MMRMSVVLPAPSGPTNPVISPSKTVPDTVSRAGAPTPKRLTSRSIRTRGCNIGSPFARGDLQSDGHTLAQPGIGLVDDDA